MIAMTTKNGNVVRLSANYHLDRNEAEYKVFCNGTEICYKHFAQASEIYNDLSKAIEDGKDPAEKLGYRVKAAQIFGDTVRGYMWGNAKKEAV